MIALTMLSILKTNNDFISVTRNDNADDDDSGDGNHVDINAIVDVNDKRKQWSSEHE